MKSFNCSLDCLKRSVFSPDRCPKPAAGVCVGGVRVCVASPWRMFVLECGLSRGYPSNPRADPANTEPLRHVGFNTCVRHVFTAPREGKRIEVKQKLKLSPEKNFDGFSEIFSPQEVSKSS